MNDLPPQLAQWLAHYQQLGFQVVPLAPGDKRPIHQNWTEKLLSPEELRAHFARRPGDNLGLLLGRPSRNLIDIDLDHPVVQQLAPDILPPSGMRIQRNGTTTHYLYLLRDPSEELPNRQQYRFRPPGEGKRDLLFEVRYDGHQTMVPPSFHPDGSQLLWRDNRCEPAVIAIGDLELRERQLEITAQVVLLIEKHWTEGQRNDLTLLLAGALLRRFDVKLVELIISTIAQRAGDEELEKRLETVGATMRKLEAGEEVSGFPSLRKSGMLPDGVVDALGEVLGGRDALLPVVRRMSDCEIGAGEADEEPAGDHIPLEDESYRVVDGRLCRERIRRKRGGLDISYQVLSNFEAHIVRERIEDNGSDQEPKRSFEILAQNVDGERGRVVVAVEDYSSMKWVDQLGGRFVLADGAAKREHARVAIKRLSPPWPLEVVRIHTGIAMIEGRPHFLSASGAITAGGFCGEVAAHLSGPLAHVALPEPPHGERAAQVVRLALDLLSAAPRSISLPLLLAAFRAPLCHWVPMEEAIWIWGPTGSRKSSVAMLFQSFFGKGYHDRLPLNWESTPNALEYALFHAKDILVVVDDFHPSGSSAAAQRQQAAAERILRDVGNVSGRERLTSAITPRPAFSPRGVVISTAEEVPDLQSVRARSLILKVTPDAIGELGEFRRAAADGIYSEAMAAYIAWLLGQHIQRVQLEAKVWERIEVAQRAGVGGHGRAAAAVAHLMLAADFLLDFAQVVGAIPSELAQRWAREWWDELLDLGREQVRYQKEIDPIEHALDLWRVIIATEATRVGEALLIAGKLVGWIEKPAQRQAGSGEDSGTYLYLLAGEFHRRMGVWCRESGITLGVGKAALLAGLAARGWLIPAAAGEHTLVRRGMRVLRFLAAAFPQLPDEEWSGSSLGDSCEEWRG